MEDIQNLIKLCKKHGIRRIKHGEIELEFTDEGAKKMAPRGRHVKPVVEVTPEEVDAAREEDLANLMITDPMQFEEILSAQGKING